MNTTAQLFQTFEDLEVYQAAREFRKALYVVARGLPELEKFDLARQIRRAAVSLTNNLAEGHGRWHYPDHIKYVLQSPGSLQELLDDLNVCQDEAYLSAPEAAQRKKVGWNLLRLMNGYLRHLRNLDAARSGELRETPLPYGDAEDDQEAFLLMRSSSRPSQFAYTI